VYNPREFEQAYGRLRSAPGELTPGDILQLEIVSPELGREGVEARQAALFPAAEAAITKAVTPLRASLSTVDSDPLEPPTGGLSQRSIDAIATAIVLFVREQLAPILKRLDDIEQQPPSPHYAGTFTPEKSYASGSLVTKAGGLWLALQTTTQVPGRSDQWKLVVKSGEAPR
jgi:hypothetical protein